MADLSQLSDADLQAIAAGDMSKVSDEALNVLAGSGPSQGDKTAAMQQESPERGTRRPPSAMDETPSDLLRERGGFSPGGSAAKKRAEMAGAAMASRVGSGILAGPGGPAGAGISATGEAIAGALEGDVDAGRIAQAGVLGGVPLGKAAGITAKIVNAIKMAGAGYAGEQARSLIDEGKLSNDAGTAAAVGGGSSVAASTIGKILAKIGGRSSPEDVAAMAAKRFENAETDQSIKRLTDQGAVVNPASQNPGLINRALGATAGLENIKNEMARINTPVIDRIGRAEAKLRPDEVINEGNLAVARDRIRGPLNELRGMGLQAEVDAWQAANQTRQDLLEMRTNGEITPAQFREQLAGIQAAMRSTEQVIDGAAAKAGRHELVGILPSIQEAQAKNYDVRRMTPSGTGHVNPNVASALAAQRVEHPEMLTGGLRDIANFNNAAYGPGRSVNKIAPHGGALGPGVGLAVAGQGGAPAAISAGAMSLRGPIARKLLSPEYQAGKGILGRLSGGARPNYTPGTTSDTELEALMTRIAAILAATQAQSQ